MIGSRNLLWLLPLFFLVGSPFWWPSVSSFLGPRGDFDQVGLSDGIKSRSFVMEKVAFTQSKGNVIDLELSADQVFTIGDESVLEMKDVQAVVYDKKRQPIRILGATARYDSKEQVLAMRENVVIFSPDGYQMRTESISYLADHGRIETNDVVSVQGREITMEGHGLQLDLESGDFQVGGRVKVTFR